LGGQQIDLSTQAKALFSAIDPVRVHSRAAAIQKVRDGDVLGALIIPPDFTRRIAGGLQPGAVDVYSNAADPAKRRFVERPGAAAGWSRAPRCCSRRRAWQRSARCWSAC